MNGPTPGAVIGTTSYRTGDYDEWTGAACLDEDPELFFAEAITSDKPQIALAKSICARCDLRPKCLDGALQRREPWGVWGGELFLAGYIVPDKKRARPAPRDEDEAAA